jgi:osmotically-inducible protein OsmY
MSPAAQRGRAVAVGAALVLVAMLGATALLPEAPPAQQEPGLSWTPHELVDYRLARSRALAGAHIRAEGNGAKITLRGEVRDDFQRQRALRIASQTPGVAAVEDRLRVDSSLPAPALRPDEDLARDVARKLAGDSALEAKAKEGWIYGWRVKGDGWEMDVEVDDGDVSLEGVVLLQPHIHEFVLAARDVPGVRSVRADLALRPNPAPEVPFQQ